MAVGNATGVVLMSGAGEPLVQLGVDSFEDQGLWDGNDDHGFCSMVAYNDALLSAVASAGKAGLPVQYAARPRNGSFFGVSRAGNLSLLAPVRYLSVSTCCKGESNAAPQRGPISFSPSSLPPF